MQQSILVLSVVFVVSFSCVDAFIEVIDPLSNVVDWFYDEDFIAGTTTIEGYIEPTNPPDACHNVTAPTFPTNVTAPTFLTNMTLNKIALINETNCDFMTKICFAQAAGYNAVVIFRTPPDYIPILAKLNYEIKSRKKEYQACLFNIVVVTINSADAITIRDKYSYDHDFDDNFRIRIIPNTDSWIVRALLSFAVWALPLLFISFLCASCRFVRDKYRNWRIEQFMQERTALGRLKRLFPTEKFSEGDPCESCIICLSHFTIGEKRRVLECLHAYHPDCIDAWLLKHRRRCPMCNRKVLLGDSFDVLDPDPSENTPLLTSSSGSNYSSGLSPIPNSNNYSPNTPDNIHPSQNPHLNDGISEERLPPLPDSVNNATQQNADPNVNLSSGNDQGLIV